MKDRYMTTTDVAHVNAADAFARELTELSRKHGIGLNGPVELFVLEGDDYGLVYCCDEDSELEYRHV